MTPNNFLFADNGNTTTTPLAAGGTYTGTARSTNDAGYTAVVVALLTNVPGTLYMEQSLDGITWDSSINYDISGGVNEIHRLTITRRFYRTRYVNNGAPQTYFRLETSFGPFSTLSSPLNSTLQQDADAIATRSYPPELEIAAGRYQGTELVNKFGRTPSLSQGSNIHDIITSAGEYTGFPVTAAEEFQVLSDSASDTGTLTFSYLASSSSTAYASYSVALNGVTPVNTGITGIRAHTMRYDTGADTNFNVGTITLRWRTTTTVVFVTILPGRSQSNFAVYTIPAGQTGFIQQITGAIRGGLSTAAVDGSLWVRTSGDSPRLRRPYTIGVSSPLKDEIYGGLSMPAGADIKLRISTVTANNTEVVAGFDIVLIENP